MKKVSRWSIPLLLVAASSVGATSEELARAIQLYYEGLPDQAISSIKSLAQAGDAEAQLTLANILYSLSKANQHTEFEDSVKWYEMAAAQNSADANSALGVIYHNKWIESRRDEDAAMAISYYERAIELGDEKAQGHLNKLRRRGGFAVGAMLLPKPKPSPEPSPKPAPAPSIQTSQATSEAIETVASTAAKSEVENSTAAVKQTTRKTVDTNPARVDLTEVISLCGQYTAAGFEYYGESINGAFLVGKARIESIEPPSSQLNGQLIRLVQKQSSGVVSLDLHKVPREVAAKLKEKSNFVVTGIVTSAQMIGSDCEISLTYQAAE